MRIPRSLEALADHGIIEQVVRPLMSGKEAQIYLVISAGRTCAAKIYKDAQNRSFKNRANYVEGRKVRNSRDQRAMSKGSKYGKSKNEDAWKCTEVDMIYRLRDAGVRVPRPHTFIDGVLVMELVADEAGHPAPRLGDVQFSPEEAARIYHLLIREVTRMLCAGVVHGDLSEFNVLLAADGPVIIDFPQAVNAADNRNARALLLRDVENLHRFYQRWVPGGRRRPYAEEMWALYESSQLTHDVELTGTFKASSGPVDTQAVFELIGEANQDEARRRRAAGKPTAGLDAPQSQPPMRRREVVVQPTQKRRGREQQRPRPERSEARRDPVAPAGSRRAQPERSEARHGRPPGRSAPSGPRRGDSVQASTYVSPEARRNKASQLKLTPRDAAAPDKPQRQRQSAESDQAEAPRKRRRKRRPRR